MEILDKRRDGSRGVREEGSGMGTDMDMVQVQGARCEVCARQGSRSAWR